MRSPLQYFFAVPLDFFLLSGGTCPFSRKDDLAGNIVYLIYFFDQQVFLKKVLNEQELNPRSLSLELSLLNHYTTVTATTLLGHITPKSVTYLCGIDNVMANP